MVKNRITTGIFFIVRPPGKEILVRMTLLQLKYFIETHRTGSTQKAAEKLNVSQSTVSVAIRSLEKELGVRLFDRTARGLFLNDAGRELFTKSEDILRQLDSMAAGLKKYSDKNRVIRTGMPPLLNMGHWPELFPVLTESFPDISFETVLETRLILLEMLKNHLLEMIIIPTMNPDLDFSGLEYFPLRPGYPRSAAMSIDHPLAANLTLTYGQIVHEPLLGYRGGESKTESLKQIYAAHGVELQYTQRCTQISTLISLLRKNIGIAYLNEFIVCDYPDLVCIPISDAVNRGYIYLAWSKSSFTSSKLAAKIRRVIASYFTKTMQDSNPEPL